MQTCNALSDEGVSSKHVTFVGSAHAPVVVRRGAAIVIIGHAVALAVYFLGYGDYVAVTGALVITFAIAIPISIARERKKLDGFRPSGGNPVLICAGNLEDLKAVADLNDSFRQPYIAQDFNSFQTPVRATLTIVIGLLCVSCIAFRWPDPASALLISAIAVSAHEFASWFVFPVYYRVVPGQIDILKFRVFRENKTARETISLQDSTVRVSFRTRVLEIGRSVQDADTRRLRVGGVLRLPQLARAVFSARMCEESAPLLPANELTA